VTVRDIARLRCCIQQLDAPCEREPDRIVQWLGAVQAQDLALAKWSLGQRLGGATDATIDAAIADGSILRTHVLRPTWHFVARADLPWMVALTAPRVLARLRPYDRQNGIDAAIVRKSTRAIAASLGKGHHLTRAAIVATLRRRGIAAEPGWVAGHLLMHAELGGVICSGIPNGPHQTYALVEERAAGAPMLSHDEALGELTRRYFQSHSPASLDDFRWWSGLLTAEAKRGVEMLGPALERLQVGSTTFFVHADTSALRPPRTVRAHLLQAFDELIVAYSETRGLADVRGVVRTRKPDGLLTRAVLLDGQAVGRWRREVKPGHVDIAIDLCSPVAARGLRAIRQGAERFANFVQRAARVRIESAGNQTSG
jgi:hypothetical protein